VRECKSEVRLPRPFSTTKPAGVRGVDITSTQPFDFLLNVDPGKPGTEAALRLFNRVALQIGPL
jgi:hypothetical protein